MISHNSLRYYSTTELALVLEDEDEDVCLYVLIGNNFASVKFYKAVVKVTTARGAQPPCSDLSPLQ